MIPLPSSTRLKRNTADERALLEASRTWLEKEERSDGIHASDLLDLRQAYYRHKDPKPISDREVGLFLVGKVLHSFVLATGAGGTPDLGISDEGSRYSDSYGIWYSTDWDKGDIAEFKTNRRITEPSTVEEYETYIQQLLVYMAIKNVAEAKLWVLFLNLKDKESGRTTPVFRCYTVSITGDDLLQVQRVVAEQRQLLQSALDASDAGGLPVCTSWRCGNNCPYFGKPCKPEGRYPETDQRRWKQ